jgi:hypothetical protein
MGTIAVAAIHPRALREREGLLLILGVLSFQFVGIAIQGKFFQYHFAASVPLVALLAGHGYYKLWRRVGLDSLSGVVAFCAFMVVAATMRLPVNDTPGGFWHRSIVRMQYLLSAGRSISRDELDAQLHYVAGYNLDVARKIANELDRHVDEGDYLYIWGFEPVIYSLTETIPSSRYVYNVPQRAKWQNERPRRTLMNDLESHPPEVIITQVRDAIPFVTGNRLNSTDSIPLFPEFERFLNSRYRKAKTLDRFSIWLPVDDGRNAAGAPQGDETAVRRSTAGSTSSSPGKSSTR